MKNKPPLHSPSQIVLGVIVIGLGLLFLLDNLGFINVRYTFRFWPTILIIFGLLKISQSHTALRLYPWRRDGLAGRELDLESHGLVLHQLEHAVAAADHRRRRGRGVEVLARRAAAAAAPALCRAAGRTAAPDAFGQARNGAVSLDKESPHATAAPGASGQADDDSIIEVTAILGGYVRRVSSQRFRGGDINVIMAGCEIDLRQASIEGEAVLNVFALCGGVTIKIPPDWSVVLQGTPILGGFEEKTIVPPNQNKRLYVTGYAIMGGLEIRN